MAYHFLYLHQMILVSVLLLPVLNSVRKVIVVCQKDEQRDKTICFKEQIEIEQWTVFYTSHFILASTYKLYIQMFIMLIVANFMSIEVDNCRLYEHQLQTLRLFQEEV
jgi:hypothetical protein